MSKVLTGLDWAFQGSFVGQIAEKFHLVFSALTELGIKMLGIN